MLGTRTKQVFSYGRRGHRIVNVSEDREQLKARHAEPQTRKHENIPSPSPSPSPPPQPVLRRRKIPKSAPLSPPESAKKAVRPPAALQKVKRSQKVVNAGKVEVAFPSRQPLGSFRANLPGSPAVPPNLRKKRRSPIGNGTPLKPRSPLIDVDIVVLDAQGYQVSQERRVSRSDVQVNPMVALPTKAGHQASVAGPSTLILLTDTEDDTPIVRRPRRAGNRARPILISSDESDREEEVDTLAKLPSLAVTVKLAENSDTAAHITVPPRHVAANTPPVRTKPQKVLPPPINAPRRPPSEPSQPVLHKPVIVPPTPKLTAPSPLPGPPPAFLPWKKEGLHALTSPALYRTKPRQLTPIRSRQGRPNVFPAPPSPPSPTTPSDFNLTLDFSQLEISPVREGECAGSVPKYLKPLLVECTQDAPYEFSAFIEMFPFDALVQGGTTGTPRFQKIGEASYSEVFGIGDVVLKVVPLRREECAGARGADDADEPAPSDARDVLKEIIVTRAMGMCCAGFVELLRAYVVRGKYPSLLLDLWDEYHEKKGSESVRPDTFTVSQAYAIIVLPNGGPDLEAYIFDSALKTGWRQACSLFWQITRTLAEAENLVGFEHRDLHWGQILVKNIPAPAPRAAGKKLSMDHAAHGVQATVIDLGLARMNSEDGAGVPQWTPFDKEIFQGEGDYQFDVYRMMRIHNDDAWEAFHPLTNVMWLHYLALKLLHSKRLRPPSAARKSMAAARSVFTERECYQCLTELEEILAQSVAACKPPPARKVRRKTTAPGKASAPALTGPKSAADVLRIAVGKGWVS